MVSTTSSFAITSFSFSVGDKFPHKIEISCVMERYAADPPLKKIPGDELPLINISLPGRKLSERHTMIDNGIYNKVDC